jgi:hypothetical protein
MVNSVVGRGIQNVLERAEGLDQSCVDPKLVNGVQFLVVHEQARGKEKR